MDSNTIETAIEAGNRMRNLHLVKQDPYRHYVTLPGTTSTIDQSFSVLAKAIDEASSVSAYIGINVCETSCSFCRYMVEIPKSGTLSNIIQQHVDAVCRELEMKHSKLGLNSTKDTSSVYIGGGTPSLMTTPQMEQLCAAIERFYNINKDTEITMESTPTVLLDEQKIDDMLSVGVNRFSFGIQRFNSEWLEANNRKGTNEDSTRATELLIKKGIRFNVDLMYGFADQTLVEFESAVRYLSTVGVPEITLYELEEVKRAMLDKTTSVPKNKSTDDVRIMMAIAGEILENNGYRRGADSWWIRNDISLPKVYEDRWHHVRPMIGYGSAAYSRSLYQEDTNIVSPREYTRMILSGEIATNPRNTFIYTPQQTSLLQAYFEIKSRYCVALPGLPISTRNFIRQLVQVGLATQQNDEVELNEYGKLVVPDIMSQIRAQCMALSSTF